MKKSTYNIILILFPLFTIPLFAYYVDYRVLNNLLFFNSKSIFLCIIFMGLIAIYTHLFLIRKVYCTSVCVLSGIIIELIFLFPDIILKYIPQIYYLIINNYSLSALFIITLITLNTLIFFRKR